MSAVLPAHTLAKRPDETRVHGLPVRRSLIGRTVRHPHADIVIHRRAALGLGESFWVECHD